MNMGKARRTWVWAVPAAAVMLAFCALARPAAAEDSFRVRLARAQGRQVLIYHDTPKGAEDGEVQVHLGVVQCRPVQSESMRPLRGNDGLTTLIVIDRGGTKKSGMGQHTDAIRDAVGGFLSAVVGKNDRDRVAIADTSGRDREPSELSPTQSKSDVETFLGNLPDPSGSGADIYGTANRALSMFDREQTPLGAMILISDGIDPAADRDPNAVDNHGTFIKEARRRGVPVAAIHIGRSGERKGDDEVRFRNGAAKMKDVADVTNGDFHSVASGAELKDELRRRLDALGVDYANVARTICEPCGNVAETAQMDIDMRVVRGTTTLARSNSSKKAVVEVRANEYGTCDGPRAAANGGAEGGDAGRACSVDPDCTKDSKCEGGTCVKRKTARDLLPYAAGGLLLLSVVLLAVGWQRKERKKRIAAESAAETARRDAERARADAESVRARAEEDARMAASSPAPAPAVPTAATPTVGIRLQSGAGSVEPFDRVFGPGTYVFGGAPDCDAVFTSPTVSGHHLQLAIDGSGRADLVDLGSSNGTFINRVRIGPRQAVELRPGDNLGVSSQVVLSVFALTPPGRAMGRDRTRIED